MRGNIDSSRDNRNLVSVLDRAEIIRMRKTRRYVDVGFNLNPDANHYGRRISPSTSLLHDQQPVSVERSASKLDQMHPPNFLPSILPLDVS